MTGVLPPAGTHEQRIVERLSKATKCTAYGRWCQVKVFGRSYDAVCLQEGFEEVEIQNMHTMQL